METEKITLSEFRQCSPEIIEDIQYRGKSFIMTKKDEVCAVVISVENFELLKRLKNE